MDLNWLIELGATVPDMIIVLMGMGVLLMVIEQRKHIKSLKYKYDVLNTWAFAADKMIKLHMLKAGNSQGDFMLDWDGIPTLRNKYNDIRSTGTESS